jgi:drug/metabolite transporter (DMT)-like permease
MHRRVVEEPVIAGVLGALTIAFSAILVDLADVSPASAAFFRCLYALPALGALAWWEDRRHGRRSWRQRRLAIPAGALFAVDLIAWNHAIADVGAGLATVLGNLQVVIVPLLGILLVSGALDSGAYGANPSRGVLYGVLTALTYAAFLLIQRQGSADLRRPGGPLFDTSLVTAAFALLYGLAIGAGDLVPAWPSAGWLILLGLTSQALGWLLITMSLPRLPAAMTSLTLTIQPIASVALGAILLGQEPSVLQLAGVACILAGLLSVALRRPARYAVAAE